MRLSGRRERKTLEPWRNRGDRKKSEMSSEDCKLKLIKRKNRRNRLRSKRRRKKQGERGLKKMPKKPRLMKI